MSTLLRPSKTAPTRRHLQRASCLVLIAFALTLLFTMFMRATPGFADVITNPTHIIDDQWNFPYASGSYYSLTSITTDMTPKVDGTPDGYFYASNFYFAGAAVGPPATSLGYMGLQDEGNDGAGHIIPKTASITIYGATGGTAASGITQSCGNPSGEGQQCNLRDVYNWVPNHTYHFYLGLQTANNGQGSEVWTASFSDSTIGATYQLGTLQVPTSWQFLGHALITFHERFSGPTTSCSSIQDSFVSFSNVTANSGTIGGVASASYSSGVNAAACPGFVYNNVANNVVSSGYGPNILSLLAPAAPSTPTPVVTTKPTTTTPKAVTSQPTTTAPTANTTTPSLSKPTKAATTAPTANLADTDSAAHTDIPWPYLAATIMLICILGVLWVRTPSFITRFLARGPVLAPPRVVDYSLHFDELTLVKGLRTRSKSRHQ